MRKTTLLFLCFLLFFSCSKKEGTSGSHFSLKETSPEYHAMAMDYMKAYLDKECTLVDTIKIDGNQLYIKFKPSDTPFAYTEFARTTGVAFNRFKQKKLGYTGVVVYCITDSGTVAHAMVQ